LGFSEKARKKEETRKTWACWENNIKMDLREMGLGDVDLIDLDQDID
jgi:hypothetical protein